MIQRNKIIYYFLILLFALDLYTFGFVFGYLLLIYHALEFKRTLKKFDRTASALFIFSVIYSLFYSFNPTLGSQFILIYALLPTTFYIVGKTIYESNNSNDYLSRFWIMILIGVFLSFASATSVWIDIFNKGFVTLERNVVNIWTNQVDNATNMAAAFTMNMGIPGILIIGYKKIKNKALILLLFAIYLISITCVLRLGSRTHLAITIFAIAVAIIYRFKKQSLKQNLAMFLILFVGINLAFSYLSFNSESDLLSSYADRMESKTHGANTAGGRTERWAKSLEYMFKKPLGWDLNEFSFAHNMWFDALRVGGIIAFIFLLIFTLKVIRKLNYLYTLSTKGNLIDGQLLIYGVCFLLVFFVEPILEGYFTVFSIFCLVLGFSSSHIASIKNSSKPTQENSGI